MISLFSLPSRNFHKLSFTHGSTVWLNFVTVTPYLNIVYSYCWKGFELWSFLDFVVILLTADRELSSQLTYFICVRNGLAFLIIETNLFFVFKNLFVKCFWHTKWIFRETQFVPLTSFSHICSKSSFLDCEIPVLSRHFYS